MRPQLYGRAMPRNGEPLLDSNFAKAALEQPFVANLAKKASTGIRRDGHEMGPVSGIVESSQPD